MGLKKRLKQLKFIANIFNLSLKEIQDTLGYETLTMIFRRVGETTGENIAKRNKGRYQSLEDFCKLLISETMEPVIGEGNASYEVQGDKIILKLNECPYKKSGGFKIEEMEFFCHYTEGLVDTSIKEAFPDKDIKIETGDLKSKGCEQCVFSITG